MKPSKERTKINVEVRGSKLTVVIEVWVKDEETRKERCQLSSVVKSVFVYVWCMCLCVNDVLDLLKLQPLSDPSDRDHMALSLRQVTQKQDNDTIGTPSASLELPDVVSVL